MTQKYPYPSLMKIHAWFVVIAWILLVATIIVFILGLSGVGVEEELIKNIFVVFLLVAISQIVLGLFLKCPNCGKRPTSQGIRAIHPTAKKIPGLMGWAVVVIDIVRKNQFRCIHCGTDFYV